jgi:redox-sensitive bicupin YhaK (pirin superfamily)
VYVVEGDISCFDQRATQGRMLIFERDCEVSVRAESATQLVLIGGAALDSRHHIWWNFVSSSKERIERAKSDWKNQRFPRVLGDETASIPLPE